MGTLFKIGMGVGIGFVVGWIYCQKNTIQLLSSEAFKDELRKEFDHRIDPWFDEFVQSQTS